MTTIMLPRPWPPPGDGRVELGIATVHGDFYLKTQEPVDHRAAAAEVVGRSAGIFDPGRFREWMEAGQGAAGEWSNRTPVEVAMPLAGGLRLGDDPGRRPAVVDHRCRSRDQRLEPSATRYSARTCGSQGESMARGHMRIAQPGCLRIQCSGSGPGAANFARPSASAIWCR